MSNSNYVASVDRPDIVAASYMPKASLKDAFFKFLILANYRFIKNPTLKITNEVKSKLNTHGATHSTPYTGTASLPDFRVGKEYVQILISEDLNKLEPRHGKKITKLMQIYPMILIQHTELNKLFTTEGEGHIRVYDKGLIERVNTFLNHKMEKIGARSCVDTSRNILSKVTYSGKNLNSKQTRLLNHVLSSFSLGSLKAMADNRKDGDFNLGLFAIPHLGVKKFGPRLNLKEHNYHMRTYLSGFILITDHSKKQVYLAQRQRNSIYSKKDMIPLLDKDGLLLFTEVA